MAARTFEMPGRRTRWWTLLLRLLVSGVLWAPLPATLYAAHYVGGILATGHCPDTLRLTVDEIPSRVLTGEGMVVGGIQRGQRAWVPYSDLSPALVAAVVAAEDATFFEHEGVDPRGVLRAFVANRAAGRVVQGGSTITQQLAKSFVGDERTLERKIQEVLVARRMERRFSKAAILEAWVNRLYWGAGATGIGAAAEIYFGVTPAELDEAQSAFLASMIPAPGRYRPFADPEAARQRRDRVLTRMIVTGLCDERTCTRARMQPLGLVEVRDAWVNEPAVERMALRELAAVGERNWRVGGLRIETTIDTARQRRATAALLHGVVRVDQRQGLRQRLATADPADARVTDALNLFPSGSWLFPVVVTAIDGQRVTVRGRDGEFAIATEGWSWAVPWREDADNHAATLGRPDAAWAVGDVMLSDGQRLVQLPRVIGAVGSLDPVDGALEAAVGGLGRPDDEFDRLRQGCRQPGSIFKPIVYSAALDAGFTTATMLRDAPIEYELGPQESWRPRNADSRFTGHVPLYQAFIWSRNLPMLEVYRAVGYGSTVARARALGITSPLEDVESLSLGASCVAPEEMLSVYATFARGGFPVQPFMVDRVTDADGRVLYRSRSIQRPSLSADERTVRMWEHREHITARSIRADNAWITGWLLEQVMVSGTGSEDGGPGFSAAGKTGTTTAYDAWFAGYTARDAAVVWVGTDRNTRPLGRRESGGRVAMPIWAAALFEAWDGLPLRAPQPADVQLVGIDPESGLLAGEGRWSVDVPFRLGTAPTQQAASRTDQRLEQMDRTGREF